MWKLFPRFSLQFTFLKDIYTYIFFFIMKTLTDIRKTVETVMDPRLFTVCQNYLLPTNFITTDVGWTLLRMYFTL